MLGIALGLGMLSYAIYSMGLLKLLTLPALWILTLLLILIFIRDIAMTMRHLGVGLRGIFNTLVGKYGRLNAAFGWIFAATAILNLIGALAPEIIFDAIWYHLTMPKYYLQHHQVYYIKMLTYGVFPRNIEMLFTLAMALGGDIAVKLLHYSFGLFTASAVFIFGRKYAGFNIAFLGAAIFYMMSNVNMLSATAYIDLGLTFFELAAAVCLLFWAEERRDQWLLLSGIFLGFALGSKHQAIILAIALSLLTLIVYLRVTEKRTVATIRSLVILMAPAVTLAAPWYIDAYLNTGNPVYPLFNELFRTGESFEKSMFASTNKTSWYDGHSPLDVITLIWKLTLGRFEGWLSPLIVLSLPLILLVKKAPKYLRSWLWFAGLFYLVYFAAVPFYTMRYFLPVVPVLSLISAFLLEEARKHDRWLNSAIVLAVLLTFAGNLGFVAVKNLPAARAAIGTEGREAYLSRTLGWYGVNEYLREHGGIDQKVLVNGAPLFYYFEFPFEYGNGPGGKNASEHYRLLRQAGFTHVMALVGEISDKEELKEVELVYQANEPLGARSNAARSVRLYEIRDRHK